MVTHFNRDRMMEKVTRGSEQIGGALYIRNKSDASLFDLKYAGSLKKAAANLRVGDTVERMLEDGDLVAVNRQPSVFFYCVLLGII